MKDILIEALYAHDDARARSQQVEIGPSQLGGCRRKVAYQLHGAPKVNNTDRLASIMGTSIHGVIEKAFERHDPTGERYALEVEVPGVPEVGLGPGHIDCYDKVEQSVTDWKTTKLKNLRYFPKHQQRWQVHTYGFLMERADYPVKIVRLVAIPRDGSAADIVTHEEPYSERVAIQALDWLAELWNRREDSWLPEPEMSVKFCRDYCEYYDPGNLCEGKK